MACVFAPTSSDAPPPPPFAKPALNKTTIDPVSYSSCRKLIHAQHKHANTLTMHVWTPTLSFMAIRVHVRTLMYLKHEPPPPQWIAPTNE